MPLVALWYNNCWPHTLLPLEKLSTEHQKQGTGCIQKESHPFCPLHKCLQLCATKFDGKVIVNSPVWAGCTFLLLECTRQTTEVCLYLTHLPKTRVEFSCHIHHRVSSTIWFILEYIWELTICICKHNRHVIETILIDFGVQIQVWCWCSKSSVQMAVYGLVCHQDSVLLFRPFSHLLIIEFVLTRGTISDHTPET